MATSTVWAAAPSARLAVRLADQPNDAVCLGGGLASTVYRATQYRSATSMTGVPDRTSSTALPNAEWALPADGEFAMAGRHRSGRFWRWRSCAVTLLR